MVLLKCAECEAQVSDNASACPACGTHKFNPDDWYTYRSPIGMQDAEYHDGVSYRVPRHPDGTRHTPEEIRASNRIWESLDTPGMFLLKFFYLICGIIALFLILAMAGGY